jgi:hypothetical protein
MSLNLNLCFMKVDLYTKVILTVIALSLVGMLLKDIQPFQTSMAINPNNLSKIGRSGSGETVNIRIIDQPIEIKIKDIENGSWWPIKIKCEDCK